MSKLERTNVHLLNTHGGNRGGVNVFLVSLCNLLMLLSGHNCFITASLPAHCLSYIAEISFGRLLSVSMQVWLSMSPCLHEELCDMH